MGRHAETEALIEAAAEVGYEKIEVRDVTGCDDVALRAIELEENEARLELPAHHGPGIVRDTISCPACAATQERPAP